MDFSNFSLFIGRFHPLLVHLPIGFIFMVYIIEIAEHYKLIEHTKKVVKLILLSGGVSGIITCVLGYFLGSGESDYDFESIQLHQWLGIITTLVVFGAYFLKEKDNQFYKPSLGLLFILLSATGHMGGNLTHGSTYLTQYAPIKFNEHPNEFERPEITSVEEAQVFGDLVYPILETKCISCHNEEKKKGNLSLTSKASILKGGKNGAFVVAGNSAKSSFVERISLPHHHEDIMPPEGKKPLSDQDIALITFWIDQGMGSFDTTLVALSPDEKLEEIVLQRLGFKASKSSYAFENIDPAIITQLKENHFEIRELIVGSNALDVSISKKIDINKGIQTLEPIKNNILWLDLKEQDVNGEDLKKIGQYTHLVKLNLSKTSIHDNDLMALKELQNLEVINLHSTNISDEGLEILKGIPSIKKIYSWNTNIGKQLAEVH
ncbi:c-type cytochrome domain-containing protein [Flammeovirga sp. EKP202]|uniref:c-type cytochrome domain-containing protein n=1 Tax=Flammeovirga sp. EKP202 TaxID=2770592 RepID=UPI00165F2518|nr:c-type cytochrome domain-containing protein [Flammeovirga sp. EKP202]MBD0403746.1 hypothetical protein [Flammeovirga sp. EKP202]